MNRDAKFSETKSRCARQCGRTVYSRCQLGPTQLYFTTKRDSKKNLKKTIVED